MYFSDDPAVDFDRYDRDMERKRERLPLCRSCKKRIDDDYYFLIDFEAWCEECMVEEFRRCVEVDFYE